MNLSLLHETFSLRLITKLAVNRRFISPSKALEYLETFQQVQQPPYLLCEALLKKMDPEQAEWILSLLEGKNPAPFRAISEEEALKKILAGEPLENVRIRKLNLSGMILEKPLQIRHSIIHEICLQQTVCEGPLDFSGTLFLKTARFGSSYAQNQHETRKISGLRCTQEACFEDALFLEEADFSEITFSKKVSFNHCHFYQGIDFRACRFLNSFFFDGGFCFGKAVFQNSTFLQPASCQGSFFQEECCFTESVFQQRAVFKQTTFNRGAIFNGCYFEEEANFSKTFFLGEASFDDCRFKAGAEFLQATFTCLRLTQSEFSEWADFSSIICKEHLFASQTLFKRGLDFSGIQVHGDTDFRRIQVHGDADFSRCLIHGKLNLDEGDFQGKISLRRTSLNGSLSFLHGRVCHECYAEELQVKERTDLNRCRFEQSVSFQRAYFAGIVDFSQIHFLQTVYFSQSEFLEKISFQETIFQQQADFQKIRTWDKVDFTQVTFHQDAIFTQALFKEDIYFHQAKFLKKALFEACAFLGKGFFIENEFHNLFSLKKSECKDEFSLERSRFHQISLEDIHVQNLLIRKEQIEDHLLSVEERNFEIAKQEFGFLKNMFEGQNLYDEMDWAYYFFKKYERKSKQKAVPWYKPWAKIPHWLDFLIYDLGCGYCTKPFRLVFSGFFVVLVFALFFQYGDFFLEQHKPQIIFSGEEFAETLTLFSPSPFEHYLYFSFCNFIALSGGDSHASYKGWLKYGVAFEGLLGLFFVTLFVTTFTRKVLR